MLLVSGKVIHLYEIWKKNYLNDDDDVVVSESESEVKVTLF